MVGLLRHHGAERVCRFAVARPGAAVFTDPAVGARNVSLAAVVLPVKVNGQPTEETVRVGIPKRAGLAGLEGVQVLRHALRPGPGPGGRWRGRFRDQPEGTIDVVPSGVGVADTALSFLYLSGGAVSTIDGGHPIAGGRVELGRARAGRCAHKEHSNDQGREILDDGHRSPFLSEWRPA